MKITQSAGFTLLEMMIAIALIAVLSLGSWQGWQHWQQLRQLNDSAQQIQRLLLRLRSDAWWHNADRLVWLKPGPRWCMGAERMPDRCREQARLTLLAPWPGVSIRSVTAEMGFYGVKNTARPGNITIVSDSGERRIIVSSRGRVRICSVSEDGCR
ncbi:prepilin peptidase-dependent protein [Erwinia sp. SLM-02]|uniref:prepilin peptidase-dependent protein n=1 Tax=Erwinia sp. SLM-02 TaxID=3020057 RepID=UPI0028D5860A|nr:prepilin peptidase-dependent protein [uncultured Erwinia sp.]